MCVVTNLAIMHSSNLAIPQAEATCATPGTESNYHQSKISSQYRGLCWDRKHKAWRVRIFYGGKQRHVGRFKDETAAARAYDKAAHFLYGDKAILNFTMEECLDDHSEVCKFIFQAKEQFELGPQARGDGVPVQPSLQDWLPPSKLNISNQIVCSTLQQQVPGQYEAHTPQADGSMVPLAGDAQQSSSLPPSLFRTIRSRSSQLAHDFDSGIHTHSTSIMQHSLALFELPAAPVSSTACQEQLPACPAALQAAAAADAARGAPPASLAVNSQAAAGSCYSSWSMPSSGHAWRAAPHCQEDSPSSSHLWPQLLSMTADPCNTTMEYLTQHLPAQHLPAQHLPAQHLPAQHLPAQHLPAQHLPDQHMPLLPSQPSQETMQLILLPPLAAQPGLLPLSHRQLVEAVACSAACHGMPSSCSGSSSMLDFGADLSAVQQPASSQQMLPCPAWVQHVLEVPSACPAASSCAFSAPAALVQQLTAQPGPGNLVPGAVGLGQQLSPVYHLLLPAVPGTESIRLSGGLLATPQWQQQAPVMAVTTTPVPLTAALEALHLEPQLTQWQASDQLV